jgi:arylformamidase
VSEPDYRAQFDATVTFSNGGGLTARDFRVDVPHAGVSAAEVGALFVASLALLMVDRVDVTALRVFPQQHKGTRGGPSDHTDPPAPRRDWVELSHSIEAGMVGDTGTHLDSPYHRYADGADLADLPLSVLADLDTIVVRVAGSGVRAVDVGSVAAVEVTGKAVLLHTGGDRDWGTPAYGHDAPYLTAAGARWLAEHGARLVGIDSVDIDDTGDPARPAHSVLLAAGIPVVEHLTGLDQLPPTGARFTAAPPRVAGIGTFPVRAYAALPRS